MRRSDSDQAGDDGSDADRAGWGPAAAGLATGGWAPTDPVRFVERRLTLLEERWERILRTAAGAIVAAGGPTADRRAMAAATAATRAAAGVRLDIDGQLAAHPLRARLWELLLVATAFADGRRAAAAAYERAGRTYLEQLGVEPAGQLRDLAAAARRGDLCHRWAMPEPPATEGSTAPDAAAGPDGRRSPAPLPEQPRPGGRRDAGPGGRPGAGPLPGAGAGPATAQPRLRLPVPLTSLIGRDELLAAVVDRLGTERLVTLTGPGGAGKTRLALAAADRVGRADGQPVVRFVDLSAVESCALVADAVAATLGVRDAAGTDLSAALIDEIGDTEMLIVLDNCEQLVAGCAELVDHLLARCRRLRILATSRIALRLPAEAAVAVPPLATPTAGTGHTLAGLAAHPATQLFLDRALARSGRPVPAASADAVARLCAELDGLPLAIELAAARTSVLGVGQIVDRLRSDPRLLCSSDPTVPDRHRTLAASVDSSVDLLDSCARTLFDRLAVFAGGFDLAAVVAVGGPAGPVALATLFETSLVEAVSPEPAGSFSSGAVDVRYRMLVPIRRHARDRLAGTGAGPAARLAHARYFISLAEEADARLCSGDQRRWLLRLRQETANLRAAMTWLVGPGVAIEPYGDLRLAAALGRYCRLEGHYREGYAWLTAGLDRHPDAPAELRARAGGTAAMLAMLLCDYPSAAGYAEVALAACHAAGDQRGAARIELTLGSVARERGDYPLSATHLAAASARYAGCGDDWGEAQAAQLRGFTAWLAGDLDRADSRLRASLRWSRRLGDPESVATALMNLGAVAYYRGDAERAVALLDAALDRYATLGFPEGVGWAHNLRGLVELRAGHRDRAAAHLALSLAAHRQLGDRWRMASVLEALAEVARLDGVPMRGAGLLGAADRIRTDIGTPVPACERAGVAVTADALHAELGADGFAAARAYGGSTPLDTLLAAARVGQGVTAAGSAMQAVPIRRKPARR